MARIWSDVLGVDADRDRRQLLRAGRRFDPQHPGDRQVPGGRPADHAARPVQVAHDRGARAERRVGVPGRDAEAGVPSGARPADADPALVLRTGDRRLRPLESIVRVRGSCGSRRRCPRGGASSRRPPPRRASAAVTSRPEGLAPGVWPSAGIDSDRPRRSLCRRREQTAAAALTARRDQAPGAADKTTGARSSGLIHFEYGDERARPAGPRHPPSGGRRGVLADPHRGSRNGLSGPARRPRPSSSQPRTTSYKRWSQRTQTTRTSAGLRRIPAIAGLERPAPRSGSLPRDHAGAENLEATADEVCVRLDAAETRELAAARARGLPHADQRRAPDGARARIVALDSRQADRDRARGTRPRGPVRGVDLSRTVGGSPRSTRLPSTSGRRRSGRGAVATQGAACGERAGSRAQLRAAPVPR